VARQGQEKPRTTAINGLIPHFHDGDLTGNVTVDDIDVAQTDLPRLAHHCSTVFQNPRTQFYTTHVRQELAFGPENLGRDPQEICARIDEVAAELGIVDLLESRVTQLSGGQIAARGLRRRHVQQHVADRL